jgi:fructokinase
MIQPLTIVGLGELLWDMFSSGRQLGGAPANFAYISNLLGDVGIVASRIGADELGNDIRQSLASFGLTDDYLQADGDHATGTVKVKLDDRGQPDFQITYPAAWDFLQWSDSLHRLAKSADAVCFGSLAQRSPESRVTIRRFMRSLRPEAAKVFDVNLRQSFYSADVLEDSITHATIVKLNHDEVPKVAALLKLPDMNAHTFCEAVLQRFNVPLICVTRGEQGSLLVDQDGAHEHPGYRVAVRDAVGAGDAFTAGLVHKILHGASLEDASDFANRMGAWVASCSGAMPAAPDDGLLTSLAQFDHASLS